LAFAVPVGGPAPDVAAHPNAAEIADRERRRAGPGAHHDALEVARAPDVTAPAHEVLALGHLDQAPSDLAVARAHGVGDLRERDAVLAQPRGIEGDLVLRLEASDRRDLGHAGDARERVTDRVVVKDPQ